MPTAEAGGAPASEAVLPSCYGGLHQGLKCDGLAMSSSGGNRARDSSAGKHRNKKRNWDGAPWEAADAARSSLFLGCADYMRKQSIEKATEAQAGRCDPRMRHCNSENPAMRVAAWGSAQLPDSSAGDAHQDNKIIESPRNSLAGSAGVVQQEALAEVYTKHNSGA